MQQKRIKVGIAGSGFASKFHYDNLLRTRTAEIELTGIYSIFQTDSDLFAQRRKIKVYDSLKSLIDNCDVIHVCTPPFSHEELCVAVF